MFCTKCGKQLDDTVAFCPQCGTKVEKFDDVPVNPQTIENPAPQPKSEQMTTIITDEPIEQPIQQPYDNVQENYQTNQQPYNNNFQQNYQQNQQPFYPNQWLTQ